MVILWRGDFLQKPWRAGLTLANTANKYINKNPLTRKIRKLPFVRKIERMAYKKFSPYLAMYESTYTFIEDWPKIQRTYKKLKTTHDKMSFILALVQKYGTSYLSVAGAAIPGVKQLLFTYELYDDIQKNKKNFKRPEDVTRFVERKMKTYAYDNLDPLSGAVLQTVLEEVETERRARPKKKRKM